MKPHVRFLTAMAFWLVSLPACARADDAYFLIMFGAQRDAIQPKYTHTFAAFVRAACVGQLEVHTISWLPADLDVRVLACRPERGRNVELHETIQWALSNDERVFMWGPYQIDPELYCRAVRQCQVLDSGEVRYKAVDSFHDSARVSNCIHAVSSIIAGYRVRVLSPMWGERASWYVLRRMKPWIVDPRQVYLGVATDIGLDEYPIVRRRFEDPRSGLGR